MKDLVNQTYLENIKVIKDDSQEKIRWVYVQWPHLISQQFG